MQEVEVKAKVDNLDLLKEKLKELGWLFKEPQIQKDVVFLLKNSNQEKSKKGKLVLRLRQSNGINILTLKKQLNNELDNIEKEVRIDDWLQAKEIIEMLGFEEVVRLTKTREEGKFNNLTICLDKVDGLGCFVEVEKMVESGNGENIQKELFDFLKSLGVKEEDRVREGYDSLVYKKYENKRHNDN